MLISLNWLKQYIDLEGISIEELEKVTNYKSWVDVSKPKEN